MTNTGPIETYDDVSTRPFTPIDIAEVQTGWTNKKTS
jgi:hypothetical protein